MDPNKEGDQGGNGKLPSVDESVVENANVTRSILESQAQEINKLMAIVGGHTTILEMLCASHAERKKTRSFDDEEKTLDPQVHHVGKKQQKKQGSSTKANWNVHALLHVDKVTKGKTSGIKNVGRRRSSRLEQPLKRKLDYDSGEGSHKPFVKGPGAAEDGSPFSTRLAHWKYMDSGELPKFFQVVFRPPQGNRFGATEMAVAAYIFAVDLDQREILFPDEHCQGDRCALWTLRPQHELVDDILNLLVKMLTVERGDESAWWLPTTFAQLALNPTTYCKDTLEFIRTRYTIKKADKIKKAS
ncbi:uncharacterized protein [Arachis hypogaea]|uniref:uncharacterized protein n=1 Tax=Arachis hypogaea TaxID=3818 RepID=UPI003B212CE1